MTKDTTPAASASRQWIDLLMLECHPDGIGATQVPARHTLEMARAEIAALKRLVAQLALAVECHESQLSQYHTPAYQTATIMVDARAALAGKAVPSEA